MNTVLLQLQKPNASMAKLELFDVIESNLDIEITEKDLHDNNELWYDSILVTYFIELFEQQEKYVTEDSFRDMQSTID